MLNLSSYTVDCSSKLYDSSTASYFMWKTSPFIRSQLNEDIAVFITEENIVFLLESCNTSAGINTSTGILVSNIIDRSKLGFYNTTFPNCRYNMSRRWIVFNSTIRFRTNLRSVLSFVYKIKALVVVLLQSFHWSHWRVVWWLGTSSQKLQMDNL